MHADFKGRRWQSTWPLQRQGERGGMCSKRQLLRRRRLRRGRSRTFQNKASLSLPFLNDSAWVRPPLDGSWSPKSRTKIIFWDRLTHDDYFGISLKFKNKGKLLKVSWKQRRSHCMRRQEGMEKRRKFWKAALKVYMQLCAPTTGIRSFVQTTEHCFSANSPFHSQPYIFKLFFIPSLLLIIFARTSHHV